MHPEHPQHYVTIRRERELASESLLLLSGIFLLLSLAVANGWLTDSIKRLQLAWQTTTQPAVAGTLVVEGRGLLETKVVSPPVRLSIPRLGVDASIVTLGLNDNGSVQVPTDFERVGWYQHGPMPGEVGPAVILGHVDSKSGPAVFYYLGQLQEGDLIEVEQAGGMVAQFVVEDSQKYDQGVFPTALVYGDIDYPGLRLVTCSGVYDQKTGRYSHNRVVYARMVDEASLLSAR